MSNFPAIFDNKQIEDFTGQLKVKIGINDNETKFLSQTPR